MPQNRDHLKQILDWQELSHQKRYFQNQLGAHRQKILNLQKHMLAISSLATVYSQHLVELHLLQQQMIQPQLKEPLT